MSQIAFQYIPDDFFWIENLTPRIVKEIFWEAQKYAVKIDISFKDNNKICHNRQDSDDVSLADLLPLIKQNQKKSFRFVIRRNLNWFFLTDDHKHIEDIICINIRRIYKDNKEYFIFCYVPIQYLELFKEKYKLIKKF